MCRGIQQFKYDAVPTLRNVRSLRPANWIKRDIKLAHAEMVRDLSDPVNLVLLIVASMVLAVIFLGVIFG